MIPALPINHVPLQRPKGAFKPCQWCGHDKATFSESPVVDPAHHAARVKCEGCGRQIAWANARQVRKAHRMTSPTDHPSERENAA